MDLKSLAHLLPSSIAMVPCLFPFSIFVPSALFFAQHVKVSNFGEVLRPLDKGSEGSAEVVAAAPVHAPHLHSRTKACHRTNETRREEVVASAPLSSTLHAPAHTTLHARTYTLHCQPRNIIRYIYRRRFVTEMLLPPPSPPSPAIPPLPFALRARINERLGL